MLQKDKCATASSKSNTSDTPVQFVKGVGPRLGAVFSNRGITTVKDLLTFFPRSYEDRSKTNTVATLTDKQTACLTVEVISSRKIPILRGGRSILEVRARDKTGVISLKWFHHTRGMESRFLPGAILYITGQVKIFKGKPEMVHPEITTCQNEENLDRESGRIVPIYTEIEGIPTKLLRKVLWNAVEKFAPSLIEDLPEKFLTSHKLPALSKAVGFIHFPEDGGQTLNTAELLNFNSPAHWRLVYEEFLKFEYLILKQRLKMEKNEAPRITAATANYAVEDLLKTLPFALTGGQSTSVKEILEDITKPYPMNRLIQGDVGSGKTAVAFLAAGAVLADGGQVALMAPTEILAEQHQKNILKLFKGKIRSYLLTGKSSAGERAELQNVLQRGEPVLVIGTHALLEDPVVFKNLCFIVIDEQHRFGVEQRRTLRMKGMSINPLTNKKVFPHTLVMTATPIPRTLALTVYGDLSVSTIRELPPGRSPVLTKLITRQAENAAYEKIRTELGKGHQAYFIYPLVNESEAEGFTSLKAAVVEADRLSKEIFPEFKVGLLHGQMKSEEKASVMDSFQKGQINILVSTTVVEVGVDVPNATVMAVAHSERFGLSQLHQLRGRVGRGKDQSHCFFFTANSHSENSERRLEVLEQTSDGFEIAEADLEIRGPGEFLGTRQAGDLPFRLANLVRDRAWLLKARDDAQQLLRDDPELIHPEHAALRRYYEREGNLQFERLKTS